MSRSKKLCCLLGLLAAVCGATLILLQVEEQKEKIKNSEDVILELPWESVTALSWEQDGKTLSFHKGETWLYDEDEAFPVSEERIQELLEQFEAFGVSFIIEDVEDYGQYGLDDPICTIDLEAGEESRQIQLGDYSKMDSKRYVSIGDGNVYLVNDDPLDLFDTTLNSMIDNDEIPVWDQVTELRFEGEETYSAVYQEDSASAYSDQDIYFVQQNGKDAPLDTSRVDSYLWSIRSLNLTDYVSYNAAEAELAQYGLDAPDLTVTVNYTAENEDEDEETGTFVLHISRDLETKQAAEQAEQDGQKEDEEEELSTAYVRVGDSKIIYEISGDRYEELMAAFYDDLRHQEVFWADFDEVYQIDVSLEGTDHTITSEKDGDERVWSYQEKEVEITDFQTALADLRADSFTSEKPTGKEEIRFTLYLENENCPEVSVKFYRYDGEFCLAEVDGKPVSLVRRSYAVDLIEAVQAIVLNENQ